MLVPASSDGSVLSQALRRLLRSWPLSLSKAGRWLPSPPAHPCSYTPAVSYFLPRKKHFLLSPLSRHSDGYVTVLVGLILYVLF